MRHAGRVTFCSLPATLGNGIHAPIKIARNLYASLEPGDQTLVHGDFHHHNLLRHGDRWLVIDPKPMVGEPEFDVPPLLWNPIGPTKRHVQSCIAAFASAGLREDRIRKWGIIRGAYLGLPLSPGETEESSPQIRVVRALL